MMRRWGAAALLCAAGAARAQPPVQADPEVVKKAEIAAELSWIATDRVTLVQDPAHRALAQSLMTEGVKHLRARAYDQALANFLEAYAKFPNPKILLNIGSTLRDMGRPADAANTYQRFVGDPATPRERVPEVTALLAELDAQLTILHVTVTPRGSDISIDGGPFVPVGQLLVTRVGVGLHLVRIRKGDRLAEITVNGFPGETKRVDARVDIDATPVARFQSVPPPPAAPAAAKRAPPKPAPAPERVDAWLSNSTLYSGSGNSWRTRNGYAGSEVTPIVPLVHMEDDNAVKLRYEPERSLESGAMAVLRIDGKGRGVAGGLGLAIARGRFEGDLLALRSEQTGAYLGVRIRILNGFFRPYVAAGAPAFLYDDMESTKLAIGVRGAGGLELMINPHLSIQADLGYEHFFGVEDTVFESDVFVPTVGVIGRL